MSEMKRFAEQVADDMGKDGIDDEVLAEGQRQLQLERTVQVRFKTPDVLDQLQESFDPEIWPEVLKKLQKWVEWGEYVTVEFDLKHGTARIIPITS